MTDRAHLFSVICSVFTYLVVGCCFYYFRTLEFLLGSYIYLTFLFSSSVCILLIHFLQLWIYDPGYGCISLICALLVVYWSISFSSSLRLEIVPSIKNASTVVYKSISVSEKAILLFLSIALALTCGLAGVLESIIGCGIGYGLLFIPEVSSSSAVTPNHLQIHCSSSSHRFVTNRPSLKLFLMIRVACAASAKTVPLPSSASLQISPDHRQLLLPVQLMI